METGWLRAAGYGSLVLALLSACSPTYREVVAPSEPAVAETADAALEMHGLAGAQAGYLLMDQSSGEIVASHNEGRGLIPASTAKLMTAVAALETLGPGHRFVTRVCQASDHLYLVGGGDPSLDMGDLAGLAEKTSLHLASIEMPVSFILDDSQAPRQLINESQPHSAYYNARVSALGTRDALVYIHWQPEGDGAVSIYQSPDLGGTELPTDWLLDLPVGASGSARFPVADPAQHTGEIFRRFAAAQGLDLPEPVHGTLPAEGCSEIARHESAPLVELVDGMLESSSNIQAELIGLAVSRSLGDAPKSLTQSAARVADWWELREPGTDWSGLRLSNHSGLDAQARISPLQMIAVLDRAARLPGLSRTFYTRLAVSGWKGWLKDRLDRPETALRVWAKTGTMNYGVGLAGRLFGQSGRPVLFVVFVSDLEARAAADQGGTPPMAADNWNGKAKEAVDSLVRHWITEY